MDNQNNEVPHGETNQLPASEKSSAPDVTFWQAIARFWRQSFKFSGTCSWKEFWIGQGFLAFLELIAIWGWHTYWILDEYFSRYHNDTTFYDIFKRYWEAVVYWYWAEHGAWGYTIFGIDIRRFEICGIEGDFYLEVGCIFLIVWVITFFSRWSLISRRFGNLFKNGGIFVDIPLLLGHLLLMCLFAYATIRIMVLI